MSPGVTSAEWPHFVNEFNLKYGGLAFCVSDKVRVVYNNQFIGGENELKELIGTKYVYQVNVDYPKEAIDSFAKFLRSSGVSIV